MAVYQEKDKNGKIIKTKDGRSWFFKDYKKDFEGNNKPYKSKKYALKSEAEEAERLFMIKKDNSIHIKFELVADDYFNYLYKVRKKSTVYTYLKDYNKHIKPFFKGMYIDTITIKNIQNWAIEIEKNVISIAYKNKIYNILNNIFKHAIKQYGLKNNPVEIFGRFQEKNDKVITDEEKLRYITYEQFKTFISVIDNPLWRTFFTFAYYTGCRKGEIIALNWNDINFQDNEITVNKTLYEDIKGEKTITSTKNNQNRKIKMSKVLSDELSNYKKIVSSYNDYNKNWFVFGNSLNLSKTTIDRKKKYYFNLCGLSNCEITMHEFRHSHVSLLINEYIKNSKERNMKIDTTKFFLMMSARMGHTIQVMQKTYMHLFPTIQDEIVELLDNL